MIHVTVDHAQMVRCRERGAVDSDLAPLPNETVWLTPFGYFVRRDGDWTALDHRRDYTGCEIVSAGS